MKKFIVIAIVALLGFQSSKAQKPILPYGDHPKDSVKKFARGNNPLAKSWRAILIPYLQNKLDSAGIKITLTESNTDWIIDSTEIVERKIKKFRNSSRYGDKVVMDKILDHNFQGMVGVFHFRQLQVIIYKADCINLLQVENEEIPQITPTAKKEEEKKIDTPKVDVVAKTGPSDIEEYIPEKTPAAADVAKTETRKIVIGDKIDENKGTFTRKVDNHTTRYYDDRPRDRLSIFFNINPFRQGGGYSYPTPKKPDPRVDPPPLNNSGGRRDPSPLFF